MDINYERGENFPNSGILGKLANALNTTDDYLVNGTLGKMATEEIADKELLAQFKQVDKLPKENKKVIKELLHAFIVTSELQEKLRK